MTKYLEFAPPAIKQAGGDATQAAKVLGLSRSVFYAKLKRYKISRVTRRPQE